MTNDRDLPWDPWLELRRSALGMARTDYLKQLVDEDLREPVLVWQMGKVASRSFVEAIERTGDYAVFHLHHTDPDTINSVREQYDQRGEKYPPHLRLSIRMVEVIDELREAADRKVRVVSGVRDPLARNVSAFFTKLKLFAAHGTDHPETDPRRLIEIFLDQYQQSIPLTWFDREIKAALGIDIHETPFDRERARLRVTEGPFDLLVLRAEDDDAAKEAALNGFFERDDLEIVRANVASSKDYADLYERFLDEFVVPEDLLRSMYDSRLCRHFYTDAERDAMRARWRTAPREVNGDGDTRKPTVLVVDPDALDWGGHFMAYNDKLAAALEEQGHPVKVICNKELDAEILERRPNFVPRLSVHTWTIGNRFPGRPELARCEAELEAAIDELAGEDPAIVYMYCGSVGHASILSRLIDRNPRLCGQVNLFWAALQNQRWQEWVDRHASTLRELDKGQPRLRITVPTARLQRALAEASGGVFDVAPHPSTAVADHEFALGETDDDLSGQELAACKEVRGPFRVLFPGTPRDGKGFDSTLATASRLADDGSIRPLLRDHPPASRANAKAGEPQAQTGNGDGLTLADRLPPNVDVFRGALDNESFLDLFRQSHISVLPYEPAAFAMRTSGLLIDSLYHGLPLVVPRGTWLADIVEDHACGVVVGENSPDQLADAVHEVTRNYPELATKARSAARAYFAENSWKALAQSIVAPASSQPVTGSAAVTGLQTRIGELVDRQRVTSKRRRRSTGTMARITYFPVVEDEDQLIDLLSRAAWFLTPAPIEKIFVPVSAARLSETPWKVAPGMDPAIAKRFDALRELIEFVPVSGRAGIPRAVRKASIVLRWRETGSSRWVPKKTLDKWLEGKEVWHVDPNADRYEGSFYINVSFRHIRRNAAVLRENQRKFDLLADRLGRREQAYILATGPSVGSYAEFDYAEALSIVCNTVVLDEALMETVRPEILVFADPIFHFGPSQYAARFRRSVRRAAAKFDFDICIPLKYYGIFTAAMPELADRTIGIPFRKGREFNFDLVRDFELRTTDNVLTLVMLPLAATFARRVGILGCDGRPLDENTYFWAHNRATQIDEKMANIQQVHPAFFDIDYNDYYLEHCDTLAEQLEAGEQAGWRFESLGFSHIPALKDRMVATAGAREDETGGLRSGRKVASETTPAALSVAGRDGNGADRAAGWPRLLVIDSTAVGGRAATGRLKKSLLAGWPDHAFLQVSASESDGFSLVRSLGGHSTEDVAVQVEEGVSAERVYDEVAAFEPGVIYYRPVLDRHPRLHAVAREVLSRHPSPSSRISWTIGRADSRSVIGSKRGRRTKRCAIYSRAVARY